jgi:secondary thiamine-phosphate synthase enzyme
MFQRTLEVPTTGRCMISITDPVNAFVAEANIEVGLCNLFIHHTSASILCCENYDEDVQSDLERFMVRLVPDGDKLFKHTEEGPDDMPSHIRSVLTATSITIPVKDSKLVLGRWQGIFLWEHRLVPHNRKITVSVF